LDWATFAIEAIGVAILLLWIVIPVREFQTIFREIRARGGMKGQHPPAGDDANAAASSHTGDRAA